MDLNPERHNFETDVLTACHCAACGRLISFKVMQIQKENGIWMKVLQKILFFGLLPYTKFILSHCANMMHIRSALGSL